MTLPPLTVNPPSAGVRVLAKVFGGVKEVSDQIGPYTDWWNEQNEIAVNAEGPLLAVIGDSMSLGIGASKPDKGFVGLVRGRLTEHDGRNWQMINLGQWGDKISDAIDRQVPALATIRQPDVLLVCIGSNDMVWGAALSRLKNGMRTILEEVPAPAHVSMLIGTSPRSIIANKALIGTALELGHHTLNPWFKWKGKQANDRFHPNDEGYATMAEAFYKSLDISTQPDS